MLKSRREFLANTSAALLASLGTAATATADDTPPGAPSAFGTAPPVGPEVTAATFAEAQKLGLTGTPSFFMNGHFFSGLVKYNTLREMVQQAVDNPLNGFTPLVHAVGPAGAPSPPVFMVHGADGEVGWFLRHLAGLRLTRPVYGVTAPGYNAT